MKNSIILAMSLVLGAGCVTDPLEDEALGDDALGDEAQEVTGHSGYVLQDTADATLDLGSASGRACYLSGVAGNITTWAFPTAGTSAGAGVRVTASGRWELYIDTLYTGQRVSAWARCITNATRTAPVTWTTGQAAVTLAPVAAGRYCFLTEVKTSRLGYSHGAFQSPGDSVTIVNDGTNWKLQGSVVGRAYASASCITVSQNLGEFFNYALTENTVAMEPSDGGAAVCFLTQLAGELDDGADWYQGLYVKHNAMYQYYDLLAKDNTGGRARCVK